MQKVNVTPLFEIKARGAARGTNKNVSLPDANPAKYFSCDFDALQLN